MLRYAPESKSARFHRNAERAPASRARYPEPQASPGFRLNKAGSRPRLPPHAGRYWSDTPARNDKSQHGRYREAPFAGRAHRDQWALKLSNRWIPQGGRGLLRGSVSARRGGEASAKPPSPAGWLLR